MKFGHAWLKLLTFHGSFYFSDVVIDIAPAVIDLTVAIVFFSSYFNVWLGLTVTITMIVYTSKFHRFFRNFFHFLYPFSYHLLCCDVEEKIL